MQLTDKNKKKLKDINSFSNCYKINNAYSSNKFEFFWTQIKIVYVLELCELEFKGKYEVYSTYNNGEQEFERQMLKK